MGKNGEKWRKNRDQGMPEDNTDTIFYAGSYTKPLDDKRRVSLPSKWRFKGDDADNSYLAIPMKYGAITVLPPDMVKNLRRTISGITMANPLKRAAISEFLSRADSFGCDKQGRVVLSETLVEYANLKSEVYMVGVGASFEIWNPEKRRKWMGEMGTSAGDSILEELGI